jgi:hypothetical protein
MRVAKNELCAAKRAAKTCAGRNVTRAKIKDARSKAIGVIVK